MSEQQAEPISGEPGSLSAGMVVPASSDVPDDLVTVTMLEAAAIASPKIAPDHEAPKADAPTLEPGIEPGIEPTIEIAKPDAPAVEALKPDPAPAQVLLMSPGERSWDQGERSWDSKATEPKAEPEPSSARSGKRRFAAAAAVVALAMVAGAVGGALATVGLTRHAVGERGTEAGKKALEASVARIDADVLALKAGLEHTSKIGLNQFNKTSERLDKIEKAQSEPAARLAKLSEAVERLRAQPAAAPAAPAAPKEVTGSVTAPAGATPLPLASASAVASPKPEVGRLPTVEGWVLRDVIGRGGALIESRHGLYEVYAGDPVPGLGRIDAIRKQDGHWVVVTSRGLIVAR